MKNLLLILIFLCGSLASAQNKNIIYVTLQPTDLGVGLRYDRKISDGGVYATVTRGNYALGDIFIRNHIRSSAGIMIGINNTNEPDKGTFFTAGISYHQYGQVHDDMNIIQDRFYRPVSFELGAGAHIFNFNAGIRMDVLKWEGNVDFGVSF